MTMFRAIKKPPKATSKKRFKSRKKTDIALLQKSKNPHLEICLDFLLEHCIYYTLKHVFLQITENSLKSQTTRQTGGLNTAYKAR
ncbi:hypothetical protein, partial [Treponema berlinense]|uniref:hypothetical protein n=1 Tax=Treponema berlinense TaxID=225004 RepID=UPI00235607ED